MRSPIGGRSRRRSRDHTRDEHDGPGLSVRVKAWRREDGLSAHASEPATYRPNASLARKLVERSILLV